MKVLLTGFSGFLGRHIAQALLREGASLRIVLHRHTVTRREYAALSGVEVVWGGFDQPSVVTQAVDGVDVVVHSGWAFSRQGDARPTVNELGTRLLVERSVAASVKKFVFVSSVAVYGMRQTSGESVYEDSPFATGQDGEFIYPSEKVGLERWLREADRQRMPIVVFRPGPIFDERKGPAKKVIKLSRWRLGINFGTGRNRMAFIHVEDCADAIARGVLQAPDGAVFNIVPSHPLRFREWIRAWGRAQGLDIRPFFVPTLFLTAAAWGGNRLKQMLGKSGTTDVRYVIAAATRDLTYSNQHLRETLEWMDRRTEEYTLPARVG